MAETKTNLRQGNAKINAQGIVSEKDLKIVTEEGKTKITGFVTIKTSDVNFLRFNVNVNEKTNSGADNRTYAGIKTVMEEYKTISEVGEEAADKITVSGELNLYRNSNSGQEMVTYKGSFFNRLKNPEEYEPCANFEVEVFISSINPEMDKDGNETGRVIVSGWLPTYSGIEPIKLVAESEVGQQIDSMFQPGQTVEFYGSVVNNRIEKVTEIPVAIGKPRKKIETSFKNELVIEGASEAYEEGVTPEKPYEMEVIKAAIQERENKIAEEKAKAQAGNAAANKAKPSGAAKGRTLGF